MPRLAVIALTARKFSNVSIKRNKSKKCTYDLFLIQGNCRAAGDKTTSQLTVDIFFYFCLI